MMHIKFGGIDSSFLTFFPITINIHQQGQKDKEDQNQSCSNIEVYHLLRMLHNFCSLPDFSLANSTMDKELVFAFYSTAIKIFSDFKMENHFVAIKRYLMAEGIKNWCELIPFLHRESVFIIRNDSRYRMGFRSLYLAVSHNKEKINAEYVYEINRLLKPFIDNYKYKELFISGLALDV